MSPLVLIILGVVLLSIGLLVRGLCRMGKDSELRKPGGPTL